VLYRRWLPAVGRFSYFHFLAVAGVGQLIGSSVLCKNNINITYLKYFVTRQKKVPFMFTPFFKRGK
jgi:hypothetical protein